MPLAQASTAVYLVLTLQTLWGLGATVAGAFNASLAIAWSAAAIAVANLSPDANRARFIAAGPVLLVAGLATIVAGLVIDRPVVALIGQIAIGAGYGTCWAFSARPSWRTHATASATGHRARCRRCSRPATPSAAVAGLVANAAGYTITDPDAVRSAAITVYAISAAIGLMAVVAGLMLRRKLVDATP